MPVSVKVHTYIHIDIHLYVYVCIYVHTYKSRYVHVYLRTKETFIRQCRTGPDLHKNTDWTFFAVQVRLEVQRHRQ